MGCLVRLPNTVNFWTEERSDQVFTVWIFVYISTLLTPSFGNRFLHITHQLTNKILFSFLIPKILKRVTKILKIGS